jgi:hypothetical protein
MVKAGHGMAALSLNLGLARDEIETRIAALGLPKPHEKPLRRPTSQRPWMVDDVRRLIALWLDNVGARSIAETFGRSPASVHGKRRWLGLAPRERALIAERPAAECLAVALPWRPTIDVSAIVALAAPEPGKWGKKEEPTPTPQVPTDAKWALGRDREKDMRFSILGFAGLRAPAIAKRMLIEFGVRLTDSAVNNQVSRLQIVRERSGLMDDYDAEIVERRAKEAMTRLGAVLRQCSELNRSFWYCRAMGGNRSTCREFHSKKFRARKAQRSCSEVTAMA